MSEVANDENEVQKLNNNISFLKYGLKNHNKPDIKNKNIANTTYIQIFISIKIENKNEYILYLVFENVMPSLSYISLK